MNRTVLLAGAVAALVPQTAFALSDDTAAIDGSGDAEASPSGTSTTPPPPTDYHKQESDEIVITGFRRNREDVLSGTSVVTGEELTRDLRPTIGDTLSHQPGVSATSFGPHASRPVLRGFQGERIRVLTDGIGSLDVSNTSVDHAVAIN